MLDNSFLLTDIFWFGSFPPYNIAGINPFALSLLFEPEVNFSLFNAFKLFIKCPAESIPDEIVVDLTGTDIGTSIKISSVKLPESVIPTITDRDFVVATVAAPTIIKEPEKPAEETPAEGAEGEVQTEGAEATAKDGEAVKKDEKGKDSATDKKPDEKKPAEKK